MAQYNSETKTTGVTEQLTLHSNALLFYFLRLNASGENIFESRKEEGRIMTIILQDYS